jgi:hypothetical protein
MDEYIELIHDHRARAILTQLSGDTIVLFYRLMDDVYVRGKKDSDAPTQLLLDGFKLGLTWRRE